jgi:cell division protein FtsN
MSPGRGQYAHGRDKDERVLRWYNRGDQSWWFVVGVILAVIVAFALGFLIASLISGNNYDRGYRDGYHEALLPEKDGSSTTNGGDFPTTTVPEPDSVKPGSGAPAPDTSTTGAPSPLVPSP